MQLNCQSCFHQYINGVTPPGGTETVEEFLFYLQHLQSTAVFRHADAVNISQRSIIRHMGLK